MTVHRLMPGTHEWPQTPECVCGADWAWLDNCCVRRPIVPCSTCGKRITLRAMSRHEKRMHTTPEENQ